MASRAFMSAFLKRIGESAPGVGAAIDSTIIDADKRKRDALKEEEDRRMAEIVRKKYLADIAGQEQQNADTIAASNRSKLGQEAVAKAHQAQQDRVSFSPLPNPIDMPQDDTAGVSEPLVRNSQDGYIDQSQPPPKLPPQNNMRQISFAPGVKEQVTADSDRLNRLRDMQPYDVAQEYAGQFRDTEAGKAYMEPFDKEREEKMRQQGALDLADKKYGATNQKQPFDPEMEKAEYTIAQKVADGSMPPSMAMQIYTGLGKETANRPRLIATVNQMNPEFNWSKAEISYQTQKSGSTAGAAAAASNLAPKRISDKDQETLTGERSIFANLTNAKDTFKENYAVPYAGKQIKLKWMRQNDPDFNEFVTNIGLAMNEYRRQNFGTAQTNSEIQNFLDVLNTDLSVKPEALERQMNTLLTAMERDYTDKIKTKKQGAYVVPENLQNIRMDKPKIPGAKPKPAESQKTVWSDDKERRYQELKRKLGR